MIIITLADGKDSVPSISVYLLFSFSFRGYYLKSLVQRETSPFCVSFPLFSELFPLIIVHIMGHEELYSVEQFENSALRKGCIAGS